MTTPIIITPYFKTDLKIGPYIQEDTDLVINVNVQCTFIDAEIYTGALDKDGKPTGDLVLIGQADNTSNLKIKVERKALVLEGPAFLRVRTWPTDNQEGIGLETAFTITPADPLSPPPLSTPQGIAEMTSRNPSIFDTIKKDLESIKL